MKRDHESEDVLLTQGPTPRLLQRGCGSSGGREATRGPGNVLQTTQMITNNSLVPCF